MLGKVSLVALLALASFALADATTTNKTRDGRLLSVFNIVKFPNDPCNGSSNQNGTCYTEQECEDKDGKSQGSCADGYGVCCVFSLNCGSSSSENCTYFESSVGEVGACMLEVCKCDSNVCQLRLDFNTFAITGPSTTTLSSVAHISTGVLQTQTRASACLTDTFTVTNPEGVTPPSICGTNTGAHMYVDASEECNDLVFQLGSDVVGTGSVARMWNIKVTQYKCDFDNLAPAGCTQWFFGSDTGLLQNYNAGQRHLADQNQNMCIRRERGQCRICYWINNVDVDFGVSGMTPNVGKVATESCCGYKANVKGTMYDCVIIPGAYKSKMATMHIDNQFCGRNLASLVAGTAVGTICTQREPFNVRFLSDSFEPTAEAALLTHNFNINYSQSSC